MKTEKYIQEIYQMEKENLLEHRKRLGYAYEHRDFYCIQTERQEVMSSNEGVRILEDILQIKEEKRVYRHAEDAWKG